MGRRTLFAIAGWLGAAAVAVLVGLAAIDLIGSGISSSASRPRSEAEVSRELAALPSLDVTGSPTAAASAGTGPAPSPGDPSGTTRSFPTRGGTVVARCVGTGSEIVSMSPAQGFTVRERDAGPRERAEGEFRSTRDGHDRVEFEVECRTGEPNLRTDHDD
ncbi:hypothetical protein AB0J86_25210 [Micromonospora sp. NPDC049559]|uniref:hypothetical protein n=1 Tax=Micromonospora sp. NPDC049559 TaxID=3155923 RepID=UPI003442EACC